MFVCKCNEVPAKENGAIDGARTRDNLDHNQGLYQLSYDRHAGIL